MTSARKTLCLSLPLTSQFHQITGDPRPRMPGEERGDRLEPFAEGLLVAGGGGRRAGAASKVTGCGDS